ncbi:ethanolamine ammonia-lyase subunit EutC [Fibrella sp. HMF5036]|uniref:Ethanolamine ammonia-lyase small subunit n=1 Tax=Fibrella aquatilis TaxID=2817059 RepID=A0A939G8U3_9BACT|nr:ethanolamine ammonia-lyase subunit EutC [Fibrella aquatilis]
MDAWSFLREHTAARLAQGITGHSLPTRALLDFQLDQARARDAVYSTLAWPELLAGLIDLLPSTAPIRLQSQAPDRPTYLKRPDLGRKINELSVRQLADIAIVPTDLSIILADGLSATAINRHALPLLALLLPEVARLGWSLAPVCVMEQARVAVGDAVAHALQARMTVVLIGERPGLTSPDSLGAYLTYNPRPGLTDESRNCVSNIRPEGLPYAFAVQKLLYLLTEMHVRKLSGVGLKDELILGISPNDPPNRAVD